MNTGIGDAVNLAWKLAAVLKGVAPPSLLETYEPERIAFARRLVSTTDRGFAFVSSRGPWATRIRLYIVPWLLPFLFRFALVRRIMYRTVSQIAIRYPQSLLSHGSTGTIDGGQRLPWVRFQNPIGTETDNFGCLSSMDWQIHCYGAANSALKTMCHDRGMALHVFRWESAMKKIGLKRNAAYVIRPDGHIGIVDPQGDAEKISSYVDAWISSDLLPAQT